MDFFGVIQIIYKNYLVESLRLECLLNKNLFRSGQAGGVSVGPVD